MLAACRGRSPGAVLGDEGHRGGHGADAHQAYHIGVGRQAGHHQHLPLKLQPCDLLGSQERVYRRDCHHTKSACLNRRMPSSVGCDV